MDCSVIIVNYNVEHFLYQCLDSVTRAIQDIDAEIIVIDNASSDGSCQMIRQHFPSVVLIENKENLGFGKANNQGIKRAKGEFSLLLNPDTIVGENTITNCIEYLKKNKISTGLGIKMIDGSGQFLPESKRSFPSPEVAFYKLFGMAKLFPKNRRFGQYHLTYLSKNENHEVDVLSGAFFMAKTSVLQDKNGFDEDFFMYGEDIDLSYRLLRQKEKNHFFSGSQIIHYKGESTKSGSLNYVKNFYQAMIIFARKHFSGSKAAVFILLINLAIWVRGLMSVIGSLLKRIGLPIIDVALSILAMYAVNYLWGIYKFREPFPFESVVVNIPIYALLMLVAMYLSGNYDKPYSFLRIVRGAILGIFLVAVVYAFFPEEYRFSRLFILIAGISTGMVFTIIRLVLEYLHSRKLFLYPKNEYRILLVTNQEDDILDTYPLLRRDDVQFLGVVSDKTSEYQIGNLKNLTSISKSLFATDIIFDNRSLSYEYIIRQYEQLDAKIVRHNSIPYEEALLSSQDKSKGGEIYFQEKNFAIQYPHHRRNKRLFDLTTSIVLLFLFPLLVWKKNYRQLLLPNIFSLMIGKKTLVGYSNDNLPALKTHIFSVSPLNLTNAKIKEDIEKKYAQYYEVFRDLIVLSQYL